jgi:hypothetical protein
MKSHGSTSPEAVFLTVTTFNSSVSTSTAYGAEHKHRYGPTVEALWRENGGRGRV